MPTIAERLRRCASADTSVRFSMSLFNLRSAMMAQTSPTPLRSTPPMNSDTGPATLATMTIV